MKSILVAVAVAAAGSGALQAVEKIPATRCSNQHRSGFGVQADCTRPRRRHAEFHLRPGRRRLGRRVAVHRTAGHAFRRRCPDRHALSEHEPEPEQRNPGHLAAFGRHQRRLGHQVRRIARLGLRGAGRDRVAAARGDRGRPPVRRAGRSSRVRTGSSASTRSAASSLPPVNARRRRSTRACWCRTRRTTTSISDGRPGRGARASPPPRAPDARGRPAECGWRIRAEGSPHDTRHAGAMPPRACSGWRPAASRSRARCAAGGSAHHAGAARRARYRLPPARYARG